MIIIVARHEACTRCAERKSAACTCVVLYGTVGHDHKRLRLPRCDQELQELMLDSALKRMHKEQERQTLANNIALDNEKSR